MYPQILSVRDRARGLAWPVEVAASLEAAEDASRRERRAALAATDFAVGRYWLVLAGDPLSHALELDLRTAVAAGGWPMAAEGPVRVALEHGGVRFELQPGHPIGSGGWGFELRKRLGSESQPFDLVASRPLGIAELPWGPMVAWGLASAAIVSVLASLRRHRLERRRAEDLLRLGQVARLSALGELAAGIAHELSQPLTAVLAGVQAADRLLRESSPDLSTAREAMRQSVVQARRAAEVLGRLRHTIERPAASTPMRTVRLEALAREVLHLLEPELRRLGVASRVEASPGVAVMADPVAVEQIAHNLVVNALQALERVPPAQRELALAVSAGDGRGRLAVRDTGPGIAHEALARVFEPFFTTRPEGLGLGLSLCETLAGAMGGDLVARNRTPQGAEFVLSLPLSADAMTEPAAPFSPEVHLVDDDQAVRSALALLIGTIGLRVQTWSHPEAFLREFDRDGIGVILLDVRMPGIGGLKVLEALNEQGSDLPVVMLTGHGTVDLCRRAFKAGAAEFLEKPVDDDLLIDALQQAIRRHVASRERAHRPGCPGSIRPAVGPRTRGARVRGLRADQQGDRPGAVAVAPHGGDPSREPLRETGCRLPRLPDPPLRGAGRRVASVVLRRLGRSHTNGVLGTRVVQSSSSSMACASIPPANEEITMSKPVRLSVFALSFVAVSAGAQPIRNERNMSLELASQLASTAVAACAAGGHAVTATVVDRGGQIKAVLRADNAATASLDSARRKAYTSAAFRMPTVTVMENMQKTPGAQNLWQIYGVIGLAGGQPVKVGQETIGAIGVGGAPGGHLDDQCALAALEKVRELLK